MEKLEFVDRNEKYPLLHHVEHLLDAELLSLIEGNLLQYNIDYPLYPLFLYSGKCALRHYINERLQEIYDKEVANGKVEHTETNERVPRDSEEAGCGVQDNVLSFPAATA